MHIAFDTLDYSERAQAAGFSEQQAKFQAHEMAKLIEIELVTKVLLENRLNLLLLKIGAMLATAVGILIAVIKIN